MNIHDLRFKLRWWIREHILFATNYLNNEKVWSIYCQRNMEILQCIHVSVIFQMVLADTNGGWY